MSRSRRSGQRRTGWMAAILLAATTLIGPSAAAGAGAGGPTVLYAGEIASAPSYDHIVLLWDERLDERVIPVATDFWITVNTVEKQAAAVSYLLSGLGGPNAIADPSGSTFLRLDLQPGVTVDETSSIQVRYTHDSGTPLRDLSLTAAAVFSGLSAAVYSFGGLSFLAPIVDADHGANRLAMTFLGQIDLGSIPLPDRFVVTITPPVGAPVDDAVTRVEAIHPDLGVGILDLVLTTPVAYGDTVSVTYTRGANPIQGRYGAPPIETFVASAAVFLPSNQATGDLRAGGLPLTTSTGGEPTAFDPVTTTISSPIAAHVTIAEVPLNPDLPGYSFFGEQVLVTTSANASTADPFVFRFEIDASALPFGATKYSVIIQRNGVSIGPCDPLLLGEALPGGAPCVKLREDIVGGDIAITVNTIAASTWNMAVTKPYGFNGFRSPVDNPLVRNLARAGSAIPVRFSLGGFRGTSIFSAGSPASQTIGCSTNAALDAIEETVSAGASSLSYSPGSDSYTYVWKTAAAWAGTCRKLLISFGDGSTAEALFTFKR